MTSISITFLATAHQIHMMEESVSRYEDVQLKAYNLASIPMQEIIDDFDGSVRPDILVIALPSVSGIDEFKEYMKAMDFKG